MHHERPNTILRTGALAFVLFLLTYGGLFVVALLTTDDVHGLAKTGQMLGFGILPALASLFVVLFFARRSARYWSAIRLWVIYSPFLVLSLCTGFLFAVRLGGPYTMPEIYENKSRCYAISIPAGAVVDALNTEHVVFNTPEWSGAIQFIPGEQDPVLYAEKFKSTLKKENSTAQFEGEAERLTVDGEPALRIYARSTLSGETIHTASVFLSGKKNDLVHIYTMLPEAPIRDAKEFASNWPESFVWKSGCSY
jgi:hypothetical protein